MRDRVLSEETKTKMSLSAKERLKREGKLSHFEGKKHSEKSLALLSIVAKNRKILPVPGFKVEVTDLQTNQTTAYDSIRSAANAINSDIKSISRREKSQLEKGINTPYRNRYIIVIKRP